MTSSNPENAGPSGPVSRVCTVCGSGPRLPQCDAAIHREQSKVGTRLQEQAKPTETTPTRTEIDLSPLLDVEEGRRHLLEALEQNSAWKLRVIRQLRQDGATLEQIGGVLGISKQAVNLLLKRSGGVDMPTSG